MANNAKIYIFYYNPPLTLFEPHCWNSILQLGPPSCLISTSAGCFFCLDVIALHCVFYTAAQIAPANLMLLINDACIQHTRPLGSRSPSTRRWRSHSSREPLPSLWTNSSSSSPTSYLASQCTESWTGRAILSTPPKTLRYSWSTALIHITVQFSW